MDYLISAHGSIDINKPVFCPKKGQTIVFFSEPGKSITTKLENDIFFQKNLLNDICVSDINQCAKYKSLSKLEKKKILENILPSDDTNCYHFPLKLLREGHSVYQKCKNLNCDFCKTFLKNFDENSFPVSVWDESRCQSSGRGGMPDISLSFGPLLDKKGNIWKFGIYPLPNNVYEHLNENKKDYLVQTYLNDEIDSKQLTLEIYKKSTEGSIPFPLEFILDKYIKPLYNKSIDISKYPWVDIDKDLKIKPNYQLTSLDILEINKLVSNNKIVKTKNNEWNLAYNRKETKIYLSDLLSYLPDGTYFISACRSCSDLVSKNLIQPRVSELFYFLSFYGDNKYSGNYYTSTIIKVFPSRKMYEVVNFNPESLVYTAKEMFYDESYGRFRLKKNSVLINIKDINYEIYENEYKLYRPTQKTLLSTSDHLLQNLSSSDKFSIADLDNYPFIRREPYQLVKITNKLYPDDLLQTGRLLKKTYNDNSYDISVILKEKDDKILLSDNHYCPYYKENPLKSNMYKPLDLKQSLPVIYIKNFNSFGVWSPYQVYEYHYDNQNYIKLGGIKVKDNKKYLLYKEEDSSVGTNKYLDYNYNYTIFKPDFKTKDINLYIYKLLNLKDNQADSDSEHFIRNHIVGENYVIPKLRNIGISKFISYLNPSAITYTLNHSFTKYGVYGDLFVSLLEKKTNNFSKLKNNKETPQHKFWQDILKILENLKRDAIIKGYLNQKKLELIINEFLEIIVLGKENELKTHIYTQLDKTPYLLKEEIENSRFKEGTILGILPNNKLTITNKFIGLEKTPKSDDSIMILIACPELNKDIKKNLTSQENFYHFTLSDLLKSFKLPFKIIKTYENLFKTSFIEYGVKIYYNDSSKVNYIFYINRMANDPDFLNKFIDITKNSDTKLEGLEKIYEYFKNIKFKWVLVHYVKKSKKSGIVFSFKEKKDYLYRYTYSTPNNFNEIQRLSMMDLDNPKMKEVYYYKNLKDGYLNQTEISFNNFYYFSQNKNNILYQANYYQSMEKYGLIGKVTKVDDLTFLETDTGKTINITGFEKNVFKTFHSINEPSFFIRCPFNLELGEIIYCLPKDAVSHNINFRYNKYEIIGYQFSHFMTMVYKIKDVLNSEIFHINLAHTMFFYENEIKTKPELTKLQLSRQESFENRKLRMSKQ